MLPIDWSDVIASVQVRSHLLVNIAIRISERLVTAAATNDHTCMTGKMQPKRRGGQHGSSREPMQQYWMRYSYLSQYRSLSEVFTFLSVLGFCCSLDDKKVYPTVLVQKQWAPRRARLPLFPLFSLVHSLPHLLLFFTFPLFPFLIHFTYFLFIPSLFYQNSLHRFQAGYRSRQPNPVLLYLV